MTMVNGYCNTNGEILDIIQKNICNTNPIKKVEHDIQGVIGNLSSNDFIDFNTELNNNGYLVFQKKLPKEICNNIYEFARNTKALTAPDYKNPILFNPDSPSSEIYRFQINDIANNPDIQALMIDVTILNIARNYLQSEPIFDFPAMWFSSNYLKEASAEAAQMYHFDLDRIKWLKFFVYINDVTMENGPHAYIKKSHISGNKPQDLLDRGYVRIIDEDLQNKYPKEDFITLCGEAGSMFVGDTKCWHKGTPLKSGHRLVLEFQYSSSLFGANYPAMEIISATQQFKDFCIANPTFSKNIKLKC